MKPTRVRYNVSEAADILEVLASDHDPVYHGHVETTPREMADGDYCDAPADHVAIRFRGKKRWRRGTLHSMIRDRMRADQ